MIVLIILSLFSGLFDIVKNEEEKSKREEFKKNDDGKPIKNQASMEIFCKVHKRDGGIYSTCFVCPYQEECKQSYYRYDRRPYEKNHQKEKDNE